MKPLRKASPNRKRRHNIMRVLIGGKEYKAVTTAVTALRFRAKYNKSCLEKDFSEEDMFKLLYISIEDENKPCYRDFMDICIKDKYSCRMAIAVYKDIMRTDKISMASGIADTNEADYSSRSFDDFDEFRIMAMFSLSGLPDFLWYELSLIQMLSMISITFNLKNGSKKPQELTHKETMQMYCIDEITESKIQEYLDAHPELIAGEEDEEDGIL